MSTTKIGRDSRVLLVDDSMFVRMLIGGIVARDGYDVIGDACTGDEAVNTFDRLRPDIVIMDLVMPGLNGIEATRRIRELDPDAHIIICSAVNQRPIVDEVLAAGAFAYLEKPPPRSLLLETLASASA
jgi:two-component system, chemotaxis family, chemotaxis protein CheY